MKTLLAVIVLVCTVHACMAVSTKPTGSPFVRRDETYVVRAKGHMHRCEHHGDCSSCQLSAQCAWCDTSSSCQDIRGTCEMWRLGDCEMDWSLDEEEEKEEEPQCGCEAEEEEPKCGCEAEKKEEEPKCGCEKKEEEPKCGCEAAKAEEVAKPAAPLPVPVPVSVEEEKPAAPEEEKPVTPEQETPAAPEEEKPVAPEEEKPVAPEEEKPVAPEEEKPAAEEAKEPEKEPEKKKKHMTPEERWALEEKEQEAMQEGEYPPKVEEKTPEVHVPTLNERLTRRRKLLAEHKTPKEQGDCARRQKCEAGKCEKKCGPYETSTTERTEETEVEPVVANNGTHTTTTTGSRVANVETTRRHPAAANVTDDAPCTNATANSTVPMHVKYVLDKEISNRTVDDVENITTVVRSKTNGTVLSTHTETVHHIHNDVGVEYKKKEVMVPDDDNLPEEGCCAEDDQLEVIVQKQKAVTEPNAGEEELAEGATE